MISTQRSSTAGKRILPWLRIALLAVPWCVGITPVIAQTIATSQVGAASSVTVPQKRLEKFTITGTVVDGATGEPIRKALVQLNGMQRRSAFSDSDGRFQFEGITQGSVSLSAQKPGYFSEQEMSRTGLPQVDVGPKEAPAVVKLFPEAVIAGKVTTTNGVPIEHVPLNLNYIEIRDGRRHWQVKGSAVTDADGRFRLASLRPGTYYLSVSPYTPVPDTAVEEEDPPKTGYPGAYYPGVSDLAAASPIQLTAGQQVEANFAMNEVPVYAVSGTISGYTPNQGVSLQVFDQSEVLVQPGIQFSEENGRFDIHSLAAGTYVIKAGSSLGPNRSVRAELRFSLAADLHNLHLALTPSTSIPVNVTMDSTSQNTRRQVSNIRYATAGPPVTVFLHSTAPGGSDYYAALEGPPGRQSITLRNIDPGRYSVVIEPREEWYVASAEYGQTNLLTDDLVVAPGAPSQPLNIVLRNDSARLTGTVHVPDGMSTPVTVVAISQDSAKLTPRVTYYYPPRDKNVGEGGFVLDSLAPGEYLVLAFDRADGLEYSNPDVMQNYADQGVHVTVSPGQWNKVALELIRTQEGSN